MLTIKKTLTVILFFLPLISYAAPSVLIINNHTHVETNAQVNGLQVPFTATPAGGQTKLPWDEVHLVCDQQATCKAGIVVGTYMGMGGTTIGIMTLDVKTGNITPNPFSGTAGGAVYTISSRIEGSEVIVDITN